MDRALGIVLLVAYIVAIVGLAAAVTYLVIRIFPTERTPKKPKSDDAAKNGSTNGDSTAGGGGGGRLYRRAKRGTA